MFEKKVLGLDIGSKNIKMALVRHGKKPVVLKTILAATPEDSVFDGELRSGEIVAAKIKSLLVENKITATELYISVNSTNAVVRDFRLPVTKASEIVPAVEFELSQSFPGILQTHSISSKVYSAPNMPAEGITAFCPNKILDGYVELAKQIGIPLKAIDINADALGKAFSKFGSADQVNETLMIVDVGYSMSQVNLLASGKIVLSRQIPNGLAGLDNLVCNRLGITLEQAERARMKDKYGIYSLEAEDIAGFTRIAFSAVEQQIRQTMDYYRYNKAKDNTVSRILLTGGGGHYAELEKYLKETFNIPVSELNTAIPANENEPVFTMMMSAIGAALILQEDANAINLIPKLKELKAASGKTVKMTLLVAIVAVTAVLAVGAYTFLNLSVNRINSEEAALQTEIQKYSVISKTKTDLVACKSRFSNLSTVLEQYNAGLISNIELFDNISSVMPEAVFSLNYSFTGEGSININGVSKERSSIADFIYSLKQVDGISDAIISNISMRAGEDEKPIDYNFALEIKLKR